MVLKSIVMLLKVRSCSLYFTIQMMKERDDWARLEEERYIVRSGENDKSKRFV
mgnify:CR=1 FL=1